MFRRSAAARASGLICARSISWALAADDPGPNPPALRAKFRTSVTPTSAASAATAGAAAGAAADGCASGIAAAIEGASGVAPALGGSSKNVG